MSIHYKRTGPPYVGSLQIILTKFYNGNLSEILFESKINNQYIQQENNTVTLHFFMAVILTEFKTAHVAIPQLSIRNL